MDLTKEQVAVRQLDTAIKLLFNAGDAVSVHTLASASSVVFADLLNKKGIKSWRQRIEDCFPDQRDKVRATLSQARNFFKHADKDPDAVLNFDELTNDETIIVATLECGELIRGSGKKYSSPIEIFQCWYFAKDPRALIIGGGEKGENIVAKSQMLFPSLADKPRFEQLALGADILRVREKTRIRVKVQK